MANLQYKIFAIFSYRGNREEVRGKVITNKVEAFPHCLMANLQYEFFAVWWLALEDEIQHDYENRRKLIRRRGKQME